VAVKGRKESGSRGAGLVLVDEGNDSSERGFSSPELPWEASDSRTFVQKLLDVPSQIFHVYTVVWEEDVVGKLIVFLWEEFVNILLPVLLVT